MKIALITDVTGHDGAYLSKPLLEKIYEFYRAYRRTSSVNFSRLKKLDLLWRPDLNLIKYDLTSPSNF